jgi:MFS transporter, FSR family, fosmidomycin resistance protein
MNFRRDRTILFALGLAHGVADTAAGWLLVRLASSLTLEAALMILLYQALAFGTQPMVGLLVDRRGCARSGVIWGFVMTAMGLGLRSMAPMLAILLAGLGSAVFHVSAGALVTTLSKQSIGWLGWFTAPGVVGLALGGYWALATSADISMVCGLVGMAVLLYGRLAVEKMPGWVIPLAGREGIGFLLLGAIAVRSLVWNLVDALHQGDRLLLVYLAVAAGVGKVVGGWLADRWGWRRWATLALLGAAIGLGLGSWGGLFLGVMLLQSVTPIALAAMISFCPGLPATGSGLALGLGIALGGVLLLLIPVASVTPFGLAGIALVALLLLWGSNLECCVRSG